MPFDPAPRIKPWIPSEEVGTALRDLAAHIRKVNPRLWDYERVRSECGSIGCAMGHAPAVKSCQAFLYGPGESLDPDALGIPVRVTDAFFMGGTPFRETGFGMIGTTAAMVADRIDHWLATGEIR